jgi:hypothetical protein
LAQIYSEKYLKKLIGNTNLEDSLQRLDKLTHEEAWLASAELLKTTHCIEGKVIGVDNAVQHVRGDVQDVGKKVEGIDNRVESISERMRAVDDRVQGVDNKLDQANRASFTQLTTLHSEASIIFTGNHTRDNLL